MQRLQLIHGTFEFEPETPIRIRAQKNSGYSELGPLTQAEKLKVQLNANALLFFTKDGKRLELTSAPFQAKEKNEELV